MSVVIYYEYINDSRKKNKHTHARTLINVSLSQTKCQLHKLNQMKIEILQFLLTIVTSSIENEQISLDDSFVDFCCIKSKTKRNSFGVLFE